MDTKKLRQKILDLAIHGKLVPQDPNDEPASVLLERIRAEKEKLIKEGKIKAPKKSKSAGDTSHYPKDVPYEVPEGWCWCKITDVVDKLTDGTHNSPKSYPSGAYMYVTAKNIKRDGIDVSNITYVTEDIHREIYSRCNPEKGDILYIKDGATCGISTINNLDKEFSLLSSVALIKPNRNILNTYLNLFLQSDFCYRNVRDSMKGVGITRIVLKQMELWCIPLPPIAEQKRIVAAAEQLLQITDGVEKEQTVLGKTIKEAKELVLDLAIHGKLVPQDPSDEPAIELLKSINPAFQASHNLHYEGVLPNGWTMARIESFCTTINGLWKGDKEPLINVGVIRNANFTKDFLLDYSKIEHINVEERSFVKRNLEDGDIIVEKSGGSDNFPVGRSILYRGESGKYSFSNFTMSLRIKDKSQIIPEYLYYALQNMYRRGDMRQMQTQTTGLHNLLTDVFMSAQIPIPPSSEQWRIVEAIENHFQTLDRIRDLLQN